MQGLKALMFVLLASSVCSVAPAAIAKDKEVRKEKPAKTQTTKERKTGRSPDRVPETPPPPPPPSR